MLHHPILARVVGDDGEHAVRREPVAQHGERALERADLVVHLDPERLEYPREVPRPAARPERAADRVHQMIARRERDGLAPPYDFPRKARRAALVRVLAEELHELLVRVLVEQLGRAPGRIVAHAHVEQRPLAKGEAARLVVELVGRDAEVEEHAVEALIANLLDGVHRREVAEKWAEAPCPLVLGELRPRLGDRARIAVDRDDLGAPREQRPRVSAAPQRAVEHRAGISEQRRHFRRENGHMVRVGGDRDHRMILPCGAPSRLPVGARKRRRARHRRALRPNDCRAIAATCRNA
jgi:hypothetical protein